MNVIKKTVTIHPLMDSYIRKTWSLLIEQGKDATYSSALHFILLIAIFEVLKEEGINQNTRELVWNFMDDQKTIDELNQENFLHIFETNLNQILLRKSVGKRK